MPLAVSLAGDAMIAFGFPIVFLTFRENTFQAWAVGVGFGLALTPSSTLGVFHPGIEARPVAGDAASVTFNAVFRGDRGDEHLERLLQTAREHAATWRAA